MDVVQKRAAERRVGRAKVDGEVERARQPAASLHHRRAVVVAVEADVVGRDVDGCRGRGVERVDLLVGSVGRFGVKGDRLDDVGAENIVRARCADRVVRAVEADGIVGGAGPGDVSEGADDGHYLCVGVRGGEDDGIVSGGVAINANHFGQGRGSQESRHKDREGTHLGLRVDLMGFGMKGRDHATWIEVRGKDLDSDSDSDSDSAYIFMRNRRAISSLNRPGHGVRRLLPRSLRYLHGESMYSYCSKTSASSGIVSASFAEFGRPLVEGRRSL